MAPRRRPRCWRWGSAWWPRPATCAICRRPRSSRWPMRHAPMLPWNRSTACWPAGRSSTPTASSRAPGARGYRRCWIAISGRGRTEGPMGHLLEVVAPEMKTPRIRRGVSFLGRLELVAQADHVDHGVDVHIDVHRRGAEFQGGLGADVDVTDLRVDHQLVVQHVVGADLEGESEGAVQAEVLEAVILAGLRQLFIKEDGVVDTGTDIRLEGGVAAQGVIHGTQGRGQVSNLAQFAVQAAHALDGHIMGEGGGRQEFDTDLIGDHVGEVQAQLGVAVYCHFTAGLFCASHMNRTAIPIRIHHYRTRSNDDVPRLVGVGKRSGNGQGQSGSSKQSLAHGVTPWLSCWCNPWCACGYWPFLIWLNGTKVVAATACPCCQCAFTGHLPRRAGSSRRGCDSPPRPVRC